jgi:hypothetical protein
MVRAPRRYFVRSTLALLALTFLPAAALADQTAVVLPTTGEGVDPVVMQLLTSALRDRVQARGYRLVQGPAAIVPGTAPLDAARSAARSSQATIGVAARVTIPSLGRYQLTIWSAASAGDRTWQAQDQSAGADVLALLERILATAVPAPADVATAAPPPPPVVPAGPPQGPTTPPPPADGLPPVVSNTPTGTLDGLPPVVPNAPVTGQYGAPPPVLQNPGPTQLDDDGDGYDTLRVTKVRQRPIARLMLGAMMEACVGVGDRNFYNHLVGPRIQFAFSQSFLGFATVAYAYYSDDPGFAVLGHAGLEGRVRLGRTGKNGMPFRFSLGYAPRNGGFLKLDMGLQLAIGRKTDLVLIPLAPTIWFLEGGNAVSMNFVIEINTAI